MLGSYGEVLVLDWGFVKVRGQWDLVVEQGDFDVLCEDVVVIECLQNVGQVIWMGLVVGMLVYMVFEQVRGEIDQIDVWSDIYVLGVILYELLSGWVLYEGGSVWMVFQMVFVGFFQFLVGKMIFGVDGFVVGGVMELVFFIEFVDVCCWVMVCLWEEWYLIVGELV